MISSLLLELPEGKRPHRMIPYDRNIVSQSKQSDRERLSKDDRWMTAAPEGAI